MKTNKKQYKYSIKVLGVFLTLFMFVSLFSKQVVLTHSKEVVSNESNRTNIKQDNETKLKVAKQEADQAINNLNEQLKKYDENASIERLEEILAKAWQNADKAESDFEKAKKDKEENERKVQKLEKDYNEKALPLDKVEKLIEKVEEAEEADNKLTETFNKTEETEKEIKKLETSLEKAKEKYSEFEELNHKLEETKANEELSKELELKINKAKGLEAQIEALREKVLMNEPGTQEKLKEAIKQSSQLGGSSTTFEEEHNKVLEKIRMSDPSKTIEEKIQMLKQEIGGQPEEIRAKLDKLQKEKSQANNDLLKYASLANKVDELTKELAQAEKEASGIEDEEVEALKQQLEEAKKAETEAINKFNDAKARLAQTGNSTDLLNKLKEISKRSNNIDVDQDLKKVKEAEALANIKIQALEKAEKEYQDAKSKPSTHKVTPIKPSPKSNKPIQPKQEPKPEVKPETKVITHNPNWQQDLRKHNEFISKHNKETNKTLPNTGHTNNHSILLASTLLTLIAYKLYKKED